MAPSALNIVAEGTAARGLQAIKHIVSKEPQIPEFGSKIDIIDIRHDTVQLNLKEAILSSLRPQCGPKTLPTLLLYNEQGLKIFEEVTLTRKTKL
jgi:hypothetical protein